MADRDCGSKRAGTKATAWVGRTGDKAGNWKLPVPKGAKWVDQIGLVVRSAIGFASDWLWRSGGRSRNNEPSAVLWGERGAGSGARIGLRVK